MAAKDSEGGPLYKAVDNTLKNWTLNDEGTYKFTGGYKEGDDETDKMLTIKKFEALKERWSDSIDFEDENDEEGLFKTAAPKQGITVYESSDEGDGDGRGYYCYYFYWNRHNDNNSSGKMGPMEFATVRNNVYKLAVTKIGKLGHPRDTTHDPDPVEPEDPDEDETNYIQVKVEVLPWVVRVNNIEF